MAEQMMVELRRERGKLNNRRLRRDGKIPAVLYGHGEENVCLAVSAEAFRALLRHGSRLVDLAGAVSESAFIRDMQWDTWGTHVLHVDFTRISADEIVEVTVAIELRGEAPGVREGGVINQLIHDVEIACPAGAIPEKLQANINHLKLEESIPLSAISLPQGAKLLVEDLDAIVVECVVPQELPEEAAAEAVSGEPEVIGAKKEEEGEEEKEEK
jgi:large subunit ribosomal protein L25